MRWSREDTRRLSATLPPGIDTERPMRSFACAAALCATLIAGSCHAAASTVMLRLHDHPFSAEVAADDLSRAQGLMNRTRLAPDRGMLFVFRHSDLRWFWMKNTLIPLDILFFDSARKLVSMQTDVPPCKQDPCPTYPSGKPARYVLELAGGTAARIGIRTGGELTIEGNVGAVH